MRKSSIYESPPLAGTNLRSCGIPLAQRVNATLRRSAERWTSTETCWWIDPDRCRRGGTTPTASAPLVPTGNLLTEAGTECDRLTTRGSPGSPSHIVQGLHLECRLNGGVLPWIRRPRDLYPGSKMGRTAPNRSSTGWLASSRGQGSAVERTCWPLRSESQFICPGVGVLSAVSTLTRACWIERSHAAAEKYGETNASLRDLSLCHGPRSRRPIVCRGSDSQR
jgi:hypothetical protein